MLGIESSDPSGGVILKGLELLSTSIHDCCGFASGFGEHLFGLVEGLFGDPAGFAFSLNTRSLKELLGFGHHGIAGLGRFIEHQTSRLCAYFTELLIQISPAYAFSIEVARRVGLLVGRFSQLALQTGDALLGSRHLLVEFVEAFINLTRVRGLVDDQAECGPLW